MKNSYDVRSRWALRLGVAASLVLPTALSAQVSQYAFSQSVQPYTEISATDGGYVLSTPTFFPPLHNLRAYADPNNLDGTITNAGYLAPAVGPGFPIGFNFTYNGESFDRIGIAHGGWISFGKSSDGNQAVSIFTSDHPGGRPLSHEYYPTPIAPHKRNRIAGMASSNLRQQDQSTLGGPTSEFRVATIGAAPNRVCVIQWRDFRYNYSNDGGLINFQIRLNESGNSVDVRFGEMNWPQTQGGRYQIGLGGRDNRDYNNRMTVQAEPTFLNDWNTTVQGEDSVSYCELSYDSPFNEPTTSTIPAQGLNFRWTPSTCPPPAWPVTVRPISFDHATVQWTQPPGVASFEYVVATTNDLNDPNAVATGSTTGTSLLVEDLDPLTHYYFFIRSICGGQPGPWSPSTRFRTQGGALLECGGPILTETYCSPSNNSVVWYYSTSDEASPIRLQILEGSLDNSSRLRIFYGPDTTGTPFWTSPFSNTLPGQVFTSSEQYMTIQLSAPYGCQDVEWLDPLVWEVGCFDCVSPLAAYLVVNTDCEEQEYDVQVTVVSLGSSSSVIISNTQGVAPTTITSTGVHVVGPFTAGIPVTLTLENTDNALCNVRSVPLVNPACATVDCGPTEYEFCYDEGDQRHWLYQGDGEPIGIRFLGGSTHYYLDGATYQAADPTTVAADGLPGPLLNVLRTSQNAANELLLEMMVDVDAAWTCVNGEQEAWKYVVACYDGCVQPRATFARALCVIGTEYHVAVTISELGSTSSVTIINDGGAPELTVTEPGTYQVGPFPSGSSVTVDVVGASVLCTWTSSLLTYDCTGVGMTERGTNGLVLYPNPTNGELRVRYPDTLNGAARLRVTDVAGRVVYTAQMNATPGAEQAVDLNLLPNGMYVVELGNGSMAHTARVSIVH